MSSMGKNEDRLSSLPEEILSNILSLMPTKFGVRTSILSKRWRYSWTSVHNLDFDDIHPVPDFDRFFEFVNRVLDVCNTTKLERFRLNFSKFYISEPIVSKWINEAVRLNVRSLDVQVRHLELPLSLSMCKTLTELKLSFAKLNCPILDPPSTVSLPCVKALEIVAYNELSDAFKVINSCPVLENLSVGIRWCIHEDGYMFKIPTLKRLKISVFESMLIVNKVVLNLPNLECLLLDGVLCSVFVVEDLSSLVEAKASCEVHDDQLWVELLQGLYKAKSLSLTIKFWNTLNDPCDFPKFPYLKQLELKGYAGLGCQLIPQLLANCSELEHLCIEKPKGGCWNEPKYVPTCMLVNLKTMKYKESRPYDLDIPFLKFMLKYSKVLKKLTVSCETLLSEKEEECLFSELSMVPRASRDCQIHFSSS